MATKEVVDCKTDYAETGADDRKMVSYFNCFSRYVGSKKNHQIE